MKPDKKIVPGQAYCGPMSEAAGDGHPTTASELHALVGAMKGFNMKHRKDKLKTCKSSHHRPFLGPDGTLRINDPAGGWRFATRLEAILVAPNTRRLQRYGGEG